MKRYTRRKSHKVKILFSLLFLIILCMMAGKVLNSDFTLLSLDNITHHVASEDNWIGQFAPSTPNTKSTINVYRSTKIT